ncbi:MAG: hypothetical protein ABIH34_07985 [Nanoarchaeota archaeon]
MEKPQEDFNDIDTASLLKWLKSIALKKLFLIFFNIYIGAAIIINLFLIIGPVHILLFYDLVMILPLIFVFFFFPCIIFTSGTILNKKKWLWIYFGILIGLSALIILGSGGGRGGGWGLLGFVGASILGTILSLVIIPLIVHLGKYDEAKQTKLLLKMFYIILTIFILQIIIGFILALIRS